MAVLLMAVLPFSDLRADESVNPGLDAKVWLEKMQQAYRQSNFELFVVKQTSALSEPVIFSHGVVNDKQYSHWMYLNGIPMGYFTVGDKVVYFKAGERPDVVKSGRHHFLLGRFNEINLAHLYSNYVPVVTGRNRIAGRNVLAIRLNSKHSDLYGYMLYLDETTNVLLQVDVISPDNGMIIECYLATHYIYGDTPNQIIQNISEATVPEADVTGRNDSADSFKGTKRRQSNFSWRLEYIPSGFSLIYSETVKLTDSDVHADHLFYSDGLADFSVYRIKTMDAREFPVVNQGPVNLLRHTYGDYEVIVVGDLLLKEEEKIAESYTETDAANVESQTSGSGDE